MDSSKLYAEDGMDVSDVHDDDDDEDDDIDGVHDVSDSVFATSFSSLGVSRVLLAQEEGEFRRLCEVLSRLMILVSHDGDSIDDVLWVKGELRRSPTVFWLDGTMLWFHAMSRNCFSK